MLLVKTFLDKSKIHGIGLFANQNIKKGTLVWKFAPGFDFALKKSEFNKLPKLTRDWILHFSYYNIKEGGYVICVDDARFFNHAKPANTDDHGTKTYANRNIKKGEEITCDYFEFDKEAKLKKLAKKIIN